MCISTFTGKPGIYWGRNEKGNYMPSVNLVKGNDLRSFRKVDSIGGMVGEEGILSNKITNENTAAAIF